MWSNADELVLWYSKNVHEQRYLCTSERPLTPTIHLVTALLNKTIGEFGFSIKSKQTKLKGTQVQLVFMSCEQSECVLLVN